MSIETRQREGKTYFLARLRRVDYPYISAEFTQRGNAQDWLDACLLCHYESSGYPNPRDFCGRLVRIKKLSKPMKSWTISQAYKQVLKTKWRTSKDTQRSNNYIKLIYKFFGEKRHFSEISLSDVDSFVEYLYTKRQLQSGTVNRYLSCLSVIWKYAHCRHLAPPRPNDWPKQPERVSRTFVFSDKQIKRIMNVCDKLQFSLLKDYLTLLLDTGMRRGELESITPNNIIGPNRLILERTNTKNSKSRLVILTNRASSILQDKMDNMDDWDKPIFGMGKSYFRKRWDTVKAQACLPKQATMHGFRHTFASRLAKTGTVSLLDMKEALGHNSIEATMHYAHLLPDSQKRAIEALEKVIEDS